MTTFLVILDEKHPLRSDLPKIVASLGGDKFYLLTNRSRFTEKLFNYLDPTTVILFLPLAVISFPFEMRPLFGYPRRSYLVITKRWNVSDDITGLIGLYLTNPETARFSTISKSINRPMGNYLRRLQDQYQKDWERLVSIHGVDIVGPFEEYRTSLQSPSQRLATYQLYLNYLTTHPLSSENSEEERKDEEKIMVGLGVLPPSRMARLLVRMYLRQHPEEGIDEEALIKAVWEKDPIEEDNSHAEDVGQINDSLSLLRGALLVHNDPAIIWLASLNNFVIAEIILAGRTDLADRLLEEGRETGSNWIQETGWFSGLSYLRNEKLSRDQGWRLGEWMATRLENPPDYLYSGGFDIEPIERYYPGLIDRLKRKGKDVGRSE